mmetsp:Transcript_31768/g.48732  ORF Transcript_31768/g.48732 Transcript_31768/m.48732 type:complete len:557 (-) Transcript_31768:150-1820(-)
MIVHRSQFKPNSSQCTIHPREVETTMSNEQSATNKLPPLLASTESLLTGFLDSEERYEVYVVKAAERPHLLLLDDDNSNSESRDEKKDCGENHTKSTNDSNESELPPPLVDGCDIPGWRHEKLIPITNEIQGVLNVGIAAPLLRRQGQWPIIKSINKSTQWEKLRKELLEPPSKTFTAAPTIDIQQASEMVPLYTTNDNDVQNKSSHYSLWADNAEATQKKQAELRYVTRFARDWEQKNVPVIITNATNDWKAMPRQQEHQNDSETKGDIHKAGDSEGWTFLNLVSRFQHVSWRFSDQHGEMMTLGTYNKYISNPEGMTDDSPLAIYDAEFGDDEPTSQLLKEYTVPPCFSPDLFGMSLPAATTTADDDNKSNSNFRPPYRWILIGPARSGTGLHIDPLWTNAWVTILQGRKRWMLFPPNTPHDQIGLCQPQIPSVVWFRDYYSRVTAKDWPEEWQPVEVLQSPGETVFVPNGWPHVVLNLELTVAVTHNYASEFGPFERMWKEVLVEEREFAIDWFQGLMKHRKDLAERIRNYHEQTGDEWLDEHEMCGTFLSIT